MNEKFKEIEEKRKMNKLNEEIEEKRKMNKLYKETGKRRKIKELLKEESAQTSVEVILLIGSILVITIISGSYVFNINSKVNGQFNQTMDKARSFILNKIK